MILGRLIFESYYKQAGFVKEALLLFNMKRLKKDFLLLATKLIEECN